MRSSTFPRLLSEQVARAGSRPLVTFYDDLTGERVELSVVTYANWVAKTAGLLQDDLGLERGGTLLVDLPTHWLGPVVLGAAWTVGLTVTPAADDPDVVVCGPTGLDRYAGSGAAVLALSLRPLGAPFAEPLPAGVVDYGAAVWGQPDAFLALDEPVADDPAWAAPDLRATHGELLARAGSGRWAEPGTRLLTDLDPCTSPGLDTLLAPLLAGGGTVWVAHPDPDGWEHRARTEQATAVATRQPRS